MSSLRVVDYLDSQYDERMAAIVQAYNQLSEAEKLFVDEAVDCIVTHVKKTSKAETGVEMRFSQLHGLEVVGLVMMYVQVKKI